MSQQSRLVVAHAGSADPLDAPSGATRTGAPAAVPAQGAVTAARDIAPLAALVGAAQRSPLVTGGGLRRVGS